MTGRLDSVVARKAGHISRQAAGLIAPVSISRNIDPSAGGCVLHHGGDNVPVWTHRDCPAIWRAWQRFHMGRNYSPPASGRGWVDIAYTLGACQHGYTLGGRGEGIRTAANGTAHGNGAYYAIVWIGGRRQTPTQPALDAIAHAVGDLRASGAGDHVIGHSDLRTTGCPHPTILGLARRLNRRPTPRPTPTLEEITMSNRIVGIEGGKPARTVRGTREPAHGVNTRYDLVVDPDHPGHYALRTIANPRIAEAVTGDPDWRRGVIMLSETDARDVRALT